MSSLQNSSLDERNNLYRCLYNPYRLLSCLYMLTQYIYICPCNVRLIFTSFPKHNILYNCIIYCHFYHIYSQGMVFFCTFMVHVQIQIDIYLYRQILCNLCVLLSNLLPTQQLISLSCTSILLLRPPLFVRPINLAFWGLLDLNLF